ncbi:AI-2E family transporter [Candidatus Clostridium helianthi]|uniref:AI-2E family transporter n=1 Tax=Candidatus Clostridium helianthi TaxID=3381660 RepID=A0ABW8S109_9CLOT
MNFLRELFKKDIVRRICVLLIIVFFMYILRSMLNLFLLTFFFTYIAYSLQVGITKRLDKFIKVKPIIVTLFLYIFMTSIIIFASYRYIPIIIRQLTEIGMKISRFDFRDIGGEVLSTYIVPYFGKVDFMSFFKNSEINDLLKFDQFLKYASNIGTWSFNIFVSLILSLFFMVEREKIKEFFSEFQDSKIAILYRYTKDFGINFLNSFGKVIQAQIIIAFVNSILSVISLFALGFPQVLGLGVMIFLFSLVPVAGTIASLIPLSIIAYTVGGFKMILYILIIIAVLHALESYVLNPRFMADKTELPVFVVFITLLVSEHFMGVWGLLLGVPLLMFVLDLLNIKPRSQNIKRRRLVTLKKKHINE